MREKWKDSGIVMPIYFIACAAYITAHAILKNGGPAISALLAIPILMNIGAAIYILNRRKK